MATKLTSRAVSRNRLKAFLYILIRDHLPFGTVETIFSRHLAKIGKKEPYFSVDFPILDELVDEIFLADKDLHFCRKCEGINRDHKNCVLCPSCQEDVERLANG